MAYKPGVTGNVWQSRTVSRGVKRGLFPAQNWPRMWDLHGVYMGVQESSLSSGVTFRNRFLHIPASGQHARREPCAEVCTTFSTIEIPPAIAPMVLTFPSIMSKSGAPHIMPHTDRMAGVRNTTLRHIPVPYWFNESYPPSIQSF